ncbi:hypothetical protein Q4540_14175 [Pseudoalteromonas carrageenovora]|uniref:hypothetical protein n=1 Tax=Pseudoalteromonas TaxID=53246 RepID=UPI0007322638|nr:MULTISPECIES: hypothetical protein [Pseudoalteromonas]KTF11866.1 hypothetical protein ATS74_06685 [Pseudoalteromonas sp. H103]MDO6635673.1 hypothetical protein [Pseudoalteromonas carrageenovora]MDO6649646.1 hypothetical protein [Pseudoalteromonas carrageenovora]
MKPTCPSCHNKIKSTEIKNTNKKGIFFEVECPSCRTWVRLNKTQEIIKAAGISLLLITSLLNIFSIKSEYSLVFSTVGFAGIFIAMLITLFGKHEAIK